MKSKGQGTTLEPPGTSVKGGADILIFPGVRIVREGRRKRAPKGKPGYPRSTGPSPRPPKKRTYFR